MKANPKTLEMLDRFYRAREALGLELKRYGLSEQQAHEEIMRHQESHHRICADVAKNLNKLAK